MMITVIALVSQATMNEFRRNHGGVTFAALDEIMRVDIPGTWDIAKYLPGVSCRPEGSGWEAIDSDRRFAERGLRALELAHSHAAGEPTSPAATALSDALFVYKQVVPGHADFDDSETTAERPPNIANTLSPERCRDLLGRWAGIDLRTLAHGIQERPNVFEQVGPAYVFKDGRQFIEYMRVYVRFIAQAATEGRYFVSFFA